MKKIEFGIVSIILLIMLFTACEFGGNDDNDGDWEAEYAIGDIGPGGGIIFYVADGENGRPLGFTMADSGKKAYYLEAATANLGPMRWSTQTTSPYPDVKETEDSAADAIGRGKKNTALILAADPTAPAALACKNYSNNGKSDWFLPSYYEVEEINKQHTIIGGFGQYDNIWSSNQKNANEAWERQGRGVSAWGTSYKNDEEIKVRPIRAF